MDDKCPTCGGTPPIDEDKEDSFGWSKRRAKIHRAVEEFFRTDNIDRDAPEPTHRLKIHPEFYEAVMDGRKTFEIRRGNDRTYKVGDTLRLQEYLPDQEDYSGREQDVVVTYVMHGPPLLSEDMWLMSIEKK